VYLAGWFPRVVCIRVSLPFEEILQGFSSPVEAVIDDSLDLVLVFAFDQLGGWFDVVGTMLWGFSIRCEKAGVEHVVDFPGIG
jgi:hypothetical protein